MSSSVDEATRKVSDAPFRVSTLRSPTFESPILRVKVAKTQSVHQRSYETYATKTRVSVGSLLLPIGLGLGGAAYGAWSMGDQNLAKGLGIGAGAVLIYSFAYWPQTFEWRGKEKVYSDFTDTETQTPLSSQKVTISSGKRSVQTTTDQAGDVEVDLVRDLGLIPSPPEDVTVVVNLETPASLVLNSGAWTKPFFIALPNSAGTIYAEKKSSSEKIGTFKGGERFELIEDSGKGSWTNVLLRDGKKSRPGWVLSNAGTTQWMPLTPPSPPAKKP